MKISLPFVPKICSEDWIEIFMKQFVNKIQITQLHAEELYIGIGNGRVLNFRALSTTHRRPKLTLLHLITDLFPKEFLPHSSEYLVITLQIF